MIVPLSFSLNRGRFIVAAIVVLLCSWVIPNVHARPGEKAATVWLVFFSSKGCSKCAVVKQLIRSLEREYPLKVRAFDIDKQSHYDLMERLEAIHSKDKFSVPLVLIGDTILMGDDDITAHLEMTVRRLADSGGAPLPYLGPAGGTRQPATRSSQSESRTDPSRCDCEKKGRPPTIGEEWDKIRTFVGKWL